MLKKYIVLNNFYKQTILPTLTLFTSLGTLICCALPALLVTLGSGAILASFISSVPWITNISKFKNYIFIAAGVLLLFSFFIHWFNRNAPCPIDPSQAQTCMKLRKISFYILVFSILIYSIGFFFAFLAADIFYEKT